MEAAQLVYYVLAVLSTGVSTIAGVLAWNARQAVKSARVADSAAQVPALKQEIDHLRARLRDLENTVTAQPTVEMVHAIQLALAELKGQIGMIGGEVKAAASSANSAMEATNRLEEFFIAKGLKA